MNATRIAGLFGELMLRLGYERFLAHGSDMGAGVVEQLRRNHATRLLGVHFSNVYWGYPRPAEPTPAEAEYFRNIGAWQFAEGAYAMLQGTKPQTLAYALNDSPIGIAAWILEKFESWTDGGARAIGLDNLCANLSLYWLTQTIGSSCRLYAEAFRDVEAQSPPAKGEVPVGVLICPNDILPAPRQWGERWLNLVHWTEAVRGGHFPAWEIPNVLTDDLRRFAATLPAAR
jgi:pimeloyl-ACP methyl ester carboxylesterase